MDDVSVQKTSGSRNTILGFTLSGVLAAVSLVGFFICDNFKSQGGQGPAPVHVTVKPK